MTYRISANATEDLLEILRQGIVRHGLPAAEAYYAGLIEAFVFIDDFPRAARERTEIRPPIRAHPHRSHLILYEIVDDGVTILRIRHGREDWQRLR